MKSAWVRRLAWVAGVLALVTASLAVYGATQPRDHEASRSVEIPLAPAEVFAILVDVQAAPCWRSSLQSVDVLEGDRFVEHGDDGDVTYQVVEREAPHRLVVRIADDDLPYGGTWTYEIEPVPAGTKLTIIERGYVDGWLMRGLAGLFMDPVASIAGVQDDLARVAGTDRCRSRCRGPLDRQFSPPREGPAKPLARVPAYRGFTARPRPCSRRRGRI